MDSFWRKSPALLYGIFFYLGAVFALSHSYLVFIPFVACFLPLFKRAERTRSHIVRLGLAFGVAFGAIVFTHVHQTLPSNIHDRYFGKAVLEVIDIVPQERYHQHILGYTVQIHHMHAYDGTCIAKNISCRMHIKNAALRPKGGILYEVEGMLVAPGDTNFSFAPQKDAVWKEIKKTFSLVELRLKAKLYVKKYIRSKIEASDARSFLEGLICGEFSDPILSYHLSRFSLQHIMVVSGFHFSLIASCFAALFSLFLPFRIRTYILIVACTCYLLFLSSTPSVLRAYIATLLATLSLLVEKKTSGLNALGVALLVVLVLDPSCCHKLSFQLSFLATFAILLLYPICSAWIHKLFPTRSKEEVLRFSFFDQLFYFLLSFSKSSWALTISVALLMLPTTIFLFNSFSLIGMIYGCFFPFLTAICMTWFFIGMLIPIPYLGDWIVQSCAFFTEYCLMYVVHAPASWGFPTFVGQIPAVILVAYLTFISYLAIRQRSKDALQESIRFF